MTKRATIILLIAMVYSTLKSTGQNVRNFYDNEKINGKVTIITSTLYYVKPTGGIDTNTLISKYNIKGELIEEERLKAFDNRFPKDIPKKFVHESKTVFTYHYHKNGRLSSVVCAMEVQTNFPETGKYSICSYDSKGRLKKMLTYNADGRSSDKQINYYNNKGNLLKTKFYDAFINVKSIQYYNMITTI